MHRTIFHVQFPVTGNDVLRFFGCISVPAEPFTGLDLVHDRGRRCRAVSAIDRKGAGPVNRLVVFRPDFSAFEFIGCNNGIHVPTLGFDRAESISFTAETAHKGRLSLPKGEGEGEG
jgi:hypothetical protein